MKKTYKTFNGKHMIFLFKVGKALVEARFTPTYTTDNEFVQKAIEGSYSFKTGELQLATTALNWLLKQSCTKSLQEKTSSLSR